MIVFASFSVSNNCADNICNLSGSNFMAISILSSIILVYGKNLTAVRKNEKNRLKKTYWYMGYGSACLHI